jgi:hypothetical protein
VFIKVYHLSSTQNRLSIEQKGLILTGYQDNRCNWKGLKYPPRIYVTTKSKDEYALDFVGYEFIDVCSFILLKSQLNHDKTCQVAHHFFITKEIEKPRLRLFKSIN